MSDGCSSVDDEGLAGGEPRGGVLAWHLGAGLVVPIHGGRLHPELGKKFSIRNSS